MHNTQTLKTMKKVLALFSIFCLVLAGMKVSATNRQLAEGKLNYVVIGVFSVPKNAIEFAENAKRNKFDAQFSINPAQKLFYVYVLQTSDQKAANEEAEKIRKETPYSDTWVFTGILGEDENKSASTNPITRKAIAPSQTPDTKEAEAAKSTVQPVIESIITTGDTKTEQLNINPSPSTIEEVPEGSKSFLFKIFTEEKEIGGDVDVMDLDKTKPRKSASYRGNEVVNVKAANKSGNISLVCEVFGYRKLQQILNFNEPQATEGISVEGNKIIVPFSLVRLKKGDIAVMYNVFFFKDAAIMRPESRYEVTSLLEMLKENPKYKIRIHGHTNGNASGKIISMGDSKNFFDLRDAKDGHGSAKKLSAERAQVIQSYLISQGIDAARMEVKAWGGKRPVYEEDSQQAKANVRVEIEILED